MEKSLVAPVFANTFGSVASQIRSYSTEADFTKDVFRSDHQIRY